MESGRASSLSNGQVVFDRYRLKALVGRGAIGVVWRAFDEELETDIALKFLAEEFLFDPAALADLKRETRRGMALAHPHILRIYGFFQSGGHAAIAMEMVEGNTLAALLAARRPRALDVAEIAEWTRQLCGALHYAHTEAQLIHRDLKPGNLLVDDRGRLRVADFGIAASLNDARSRRTAATDSPSNSGTPSYMSPQQLLGQKPHVEHDVYSLGATLYDLLTGRPPFHSGDISLQIRTVTPPPLAERRAENGFTGGPIAPEWEETIAACLAKDASQRPPSAAHVAERLGLGPVALAGTAAPIVGGSLSPFPSASAAPTVAQPSGGRASRSGARTRDTSGASLAETPAAGGAGWLWKLGAVAAMVAVIVIAMRFSRQPPAVAPETKPVAEQSRATPISTPPAPAIDKNSVAVLAFKNLGGDKGHDYFSDGLSEALADALGRVPGLRVAGSASAFAFKDRPVPNPEIARQLGVAHLVEGTVRQDDKRVRVTAKLVNAAGFQVWVSDNLDREVKDIFALYDELAGLIAQQLSLKLGVSPPVATAAVNPQAFELYLQGRQLCTLTGRPDIDRAEVLFKQALDLDPKFARTYVALADCVMFRSDRQLGAYDRGETPKSQQVFSRIEQALALDPNLAEAHASRGQAQFLSWQFADAVRKQRQAIALNPSYANAHRWLGQALLTDGRVDEGLAEYQLAARLDPLSVVMLDECATVLLFTGRFDEALRDAERALEVKPHAFSPLYTKARVLNALHRPREAVAIIAELTPDNLGHERRMILMGAGQVAEAEAQLPARTGPRRFIELAALGRVDESVAALEEARFNVLDLLTIYYEPFCAPLRRDPRIAQLLARLGQAEAFARVQAWWAAHPPAPKK